MKRGWRLLKGKTGGVPGKRNLGTLMKRVGERERDCEDEEEKGCEALTEFLGGDDDDDASVGCFRNKGWRGRDLLIIIKLFVLN